jgi:predicted molibdopterin-dependent oxidoreductase YjgC
MAERIPVTRGGALTLLLDGAPIQAYPGETVATALAAAGLAAIRRSARRGAPRGVFCAMGICYECLIYLDGRAVRACMTPVCEGMRLTTWAPLAAAPSAAAPSPAAPSPAAPSADAPLPGEVAGP